DAGLLAADRETSEYFEATLAMLKPADAPSGAKLAANWINGELAAALNRAAVPIAASPVRPETLAGLLARIADGTLSSKMAKDVFDALWVGESSVDAVIEKRGLKQLSDAGAIGK